jgi:glycosyltransferase involved in cell wall biosynthesis
MVSSATTSPGPGQRVILFGSYGPSLTNFRGPLIAALVARGHQVFALAPDIGDAIAGELRALGAEPVSVALQRGSLDPRVARRTARQVERLFRELRPDAVIAYTITPIVLGAGAAAAVGARFIPIVTGLGYSFLGGLRPKRLLLRLAAMAMYRRAFGRAAIALFQNEDDRRDFRRMRLLPRRLPTAIVNGSGVDLGRFEAQPVPEGPSYLMISRFLKEKGLREYARAGAALKRAHPDARFKLVGWLDHSPDAVSQAELDAMIAGGVENVGQLEDVRPALAEASVYVLPSYREGTPRSVLEAMAVGRAIVTTDAPGCRETVVDGVNGFLVAPGDADALRVAMARFINDPALARRMGRESRRMVEEKYDVNKVNEAIMAHAGF